MIALTIAVTIAVASIIAWFAAGGMFSATAGRGVSTILFGCALLGLISGLVWPSVVIVGFALFMAFMSICAGGN
jgi:hypothetical protein